MSQHRGLTGNKLRVPGKQGKTIIAKYNGTCYDCKGVLKKGTYIWYNWEDKKARHVECPT